MTKFVLNIKFIFFNVFRIACNNVTKIFANIYFGSTLQMILFYKCHITEECRFLFNKIIELKQKNLNIYVIFYFEFIDFRSLISK